MAIVNRNPTLTTLYSHRQRPSVGHRVCVRRIFAPLYRSDHPDYRRKFVFTGHVHQRAGVKGTQDGPEQPGWRELVTGVKKK